MSALLRHLGRYAIAIATTAAAAALGYLFSPFVQPALMHLFLVSVAAAALYGGLGPGLFAVGLGALVASYLFFDPPQNFAVTDPDQVARLVVFAFAGVAVTLLGVSLRRARTRAEQDVVEKARLTELAEQATLQAEEEAARAEEETARAEDEAARAGAATQRIRTILESISDGFIALDREWRITYLNPAGVRVVETSGQSPADAYGRTLWAVWPDLEGTEVERGYRRAMQEQVPVHLEYLSPRGGFWFEIRAYASSEGLGLFFHDISERKQAEELLRDSESRLRLLTETAPTFIWEADAEGTITYATEQWYAFSGLTAEQTARDWLEVIHPDDQDRCVTAWRTALAAGTDYELRVRNRRVDGEYRWMLARAVPLQDADGRVTRWFGTSTDIHDQVEAEAALRDSETRLRLALDAGKCGVWDWDIRNDRVTWSDRIYQFHGLAPGEFGGRVEDFQRLIHPEDRERVASALAQALDRGGEYEIEFRALRPDGGVRWLATSGRLIRDDAGHPARMLGATIDLTERRRVEEHLRQSQQLELVGQLAGGVAHEVNNQMSVVLGCADFVLRRGDVPEVVRSDVEQMQSAAYRSASVTGQLLAFSRRQLLRPQVLDISRVVEDFAEVLQRTLGPDILLRLKCVQDPGPV
ncbi:MAG: PAS domain-containing protein, partial [Gemmatimonadales bacterium]